MLDNSAREKQNSDFVRLMEAMRAHYKSGVYTSYALPVSVVFHAQNEELPEEAKKETRKFEDQVNSFDDDQKNTLDTNSQQYIDDKNYDEFKRKMEEEREKAKEVAGENIDGYYDKMIDVGIKHPEAQNAILLVTRAVSDFFNGVLSEIEGLVLELVQKIVQWLEEAFEKIGDFFSNIGNTVKSFFDGLF